MAARAVQEFYLPLRFTAASLVKTGQGMLAGLFVSSVSGSPTVTIYDGTTTGGLKVVGAFVPAAAKAYPFPIQFITGLYIDVSGTLEATVFYQ